MIATLPREILLPRLTFPAWVKRLGDPLRMFGHGAFGKPFAQPMGGAGVAKLFDVTTLPSYYVDFNAASLSGLADGEGISTWTDTNSSIAIVHGTADNQPTKQTVSNGGKSFAVARFDGTNDFLATGASVTHDIGTNDFAVMLVVNFSSVANESFFANGGFDPMFNVISGQPQIYDSGFRVSGDSVSASAWYWLLYQRVSGTLKFYKNGTISPTTPAYTDSISNAVWRMGQSGANDRWMSGDIARMIVVKAAISDANIANLDGYMTSVYGIA